jgi:ketosteroid isomerase-like protein
MNITESEILEFLKGYMSAASSRVFANIAEMIHPRALFRFAEGDFSGIDNIRIAFESAWVVAVVDEKYSFMNTHVVTSDTRSAVVAYSFSWSGVENGQPFSMTGRATTVLVRDGDKLQCIYEHLSR